MSVSGASGRSGGAVALLSWTGTGDDRAPASRNGGCAVKFVLRLLITAAALWVAVQLVPGIQHSGTWISLLGVALVFGVVNAFVRPLLLILTCPLVLLTLGLFLLVLNALLLWLTGALSTALGLGFEVHGFLAALLGGIIVGLVSTALNIFVGKKPQRRN